MSADDGLLLRRGWLYRWVWFCGDGRLEWFLEWQLQRARVDAKGGLQLQQQQQHPARFPGGRRHQRCQRGAGGRRGVLRIVHSVGGPHPRGSRPANQPANQPADQPADQPTSRPASRPANQPTSRPASRPASPTSELRTSEGLGLSNAPNAASTNIDSVSPHILFLLFTPR